MGKKNKKTSKKKGGSATKTRNSSHNKGQKINRWDENRMKMAIEEYKKGTTPLRQLARAWDVPKSTFQRRVKGTVSGSDACGSDLMHASGRKCVFTESEEEELGKLLRTLGQRGFTLTGTKVRSVAYQYAEKTGKNRFSMAKGTAGYYWLKGFMARQRLSFRTPEALSCRPS